MKDDDKAQQIITNVITATADTNQFGISPIPIHTHNGTDSSLVTVVDLPTGTPIKIGLGGMISTSNAAIAAPGSTAEQIQVAIVSGKDQAGAVGISTNNLQLNLLHQPQNASNQSFINALRPPAFGPIPGTTVTVTAGGTTVTITGYGFTTNALAGASINIFTAAGVFIETQTIASNTSTVITIVGTWGATTNPAIWFIFQPVFLGSADTPFQRLYTSEGTGGGIRFGVGPTNAGQNGLLYMDSAGALWWRNKAGISTKLSS